MIRRASPLQVFCIRAQGRLFMQLKQVIVSHHRDLGQASSSSSDPTWSWWARFMVCQTGVVNTFEDDEMIGEPQHTLCIYMYIHTYTPCLEFCCFPTCRKIVFHLVCPEYINSPCPSQLHPKYPDTSKRERYIHHMRR